MPRDSDTALAQLLVKAQLPNAKPEAAEAGSAQCMLELFTWMGRSKESFPIGLGATGSQPWGRIYTLPVGRCGKSTFPFLPSSKLVVRLNGSYLLLAENTHANVPQHCLFLSALGFCAFMKVFPSSKTRRIKSYICSLNFHLVTYII